MATFADVDRIIAKWNGKYAGVQYGGIFQCVAWAAQFSGELTGIGYLPTPNTNGARDIYEVFSAPLPSGYDRIANTPSFIPKKADMVVWGAMPSNPYGHVAIANGVGDTNTFQSYDQNWTGGEKVHLVTHNYNYVLGVLRPKNLKEGAPVVMATRQDTEALFRGFLGRGGGNEWDGQPFDVATNGIRNSPEAQAYAARILSTPAPDVLLIENANLKAQVAQLTKQYQDLLAKPTVTGGIDQVTKDQIAETNTIVKWIKAVWPFK